MSLHERLPRIQPLASWGLASALLLIAYSPILIAPLGAGSAKAIEYWLFVPGQELPVVSVAIAMWLLSRTPRPTPTIDGDRIPTRLIAASLIVSVGLSAWACMVGMYAWLLPSFGLFVVAAAACAKPRLRIRDTAVAACVPLLSFPLPEPVTSELVWWLQNVSVAGAFETTSWLGLGVERDGLEIRVDRFAFVVIESCSGLRGIRILLLMSMIVAELHHLRPRSRGLILILAIPIGIGLNILRIAAVVWTQPQLHELGFDTHSFQGFVVIAAGTVGLYLASGGLARIDARPSRPARPAHRRTEWLREPPHAVILAAAAALALSSVAAPKLIQPESQGLKPIVLSEALGAWTSAELERDYYFPYSFPLAEVRRRYTARLPRWRREAVIESFVARERPDPSLLGRIPLEKLLLPFHDWSILDYSERRLWSHGLSVYRAVVERRRGADTALTYAWVRHDRGFWIESVRSLLGTDRLRPDQPSRVVFRLSVPLTGNDAVGIDRGEKTVDAFLSTFKSELDAL